MNQAPKQSRLAAYVKRADDLAGELLEKVTLGLYQAVDTEERSTGMQIEPVHNGLEQQAGGVAPLSGGGLQFGSGRIRDKLLRKLRRAEEQAFEHAIEYARVNYEAQAAQREISSLRLAAMFREVSDVDLMNKLIKVTESASPEQQDELLYQIQRYQEDSGQLADLAGEAILRKFVANTMGTAGYGFLE